jgi:hypothetical protein
MVNSLGSCPKDPVRIGDLRASFSNRLLFLVTVKKKGLKVKSFTLVVAREELKGSKVSKET